MVSLLLLVGSIISLALGIKALLTKKVAWSKSREIQGTAAVVIGAIATANGFLLILAFLYMLLTFRGRI